MTLKKRTGKARRSLSPNLSAGPLAVFILIIAASSCTAVKDGGVPFAYNPYSACDASDDDDVCVLEDQYFIREDEKDADVVKESDKEQDDKAFQICDASDEDDVCVLGIEPDTPQIVTGGAADSLSVAVAVRREVIIKKGIASRREPPEPEPVRYEVCDACDDDLLCELGYVYEGKKDWGRYITEAVSAGLAMAGLRRGKGVEMKGVPGGAGNGSTSPLIKAVGSETVTAEEGAVLMMGALVIDRVRINYNSGMMSVVLWLRNASRNPLLFNYSIIFCDGNGTVLPSHKERFLGITIAPEDTVMVYNRCLSSDAVYVAFSIKAP